MTVLAAIAFSSLLLEDDNLVALIERGLILLAVTVVNLVGCYFAYNFGSFYGGGADLYCSVVVNEKHTVKLYGLAGLYSVAEIVNIQELAVLSFELLALDFYNCVHYWLMYQ